MAERIEYCGLHRHSSGSLLDGYGRGAQIAERLVELGQKACGITDHGTVLMHAEFSAELIKRGIRPVFGVEYYHVPFLRQAAKRGSRTKEEAEGYDIAHITVLAKDQVGYRNLLKLSTLSYEKGFYKKPSIDTESLLCHQEGLIVLSGCVIGHISRLINKNELDKAREWLDYFKRSIEHFYVEICPCPSLQISKTACTHLWEMAHELEIPCVVTDDAHFPKPSDYLAQDTLLCANTRTRWRPYREFQLPEYHFHCSGEEILQRARETLPDVPVADLVRAIEQSVTIAESCTAELPRSTGPIFKIEKIPAGMQPIDLLRQWVQEGKAYRRKLGLLPPEDSAEWQTYLQREEYEFGIIAHHKFEGYFLIVSDMVRWANENNCWCIARGSCGGSLLCWYLGITQIDPIRFDLPVERFIDYTRSDLPDIDVDFDAEARDRVFAYLESEYGTEHCAHIAALSSFGARQALNDVGFVHEIPVGDLAVLTALVPEAEEADEGLHDAQVLRRLYLTSETARTIFKKHRKLLLAIQLEGQFRTSSVHAAGFIVDSKPLTETVGICSRPGKVRCVAVNKDYAAQQGLLKIDVLSSYTMTGIVHCLKVIGKDVHWLYQLPLDDPDTFGILGDGLNQGLFQIQGSAAGRILKDLKPETFDELAAVVALARPGPMQSGSVEHFIQRARGYEGSPVLHPIFQKILDRTHGIILYQEQVMGVAREAGGFDWGKVGKVRKLISKSGGANAVLEYEPEYLAGAKEREIPEEEARQVWQQCLAAGNYLFNAAHGYAYALVAYWTAYLKAHYPSEFTAAMAQCFRGQAAEDKRRLLFRDFQRMGGKVKLLDYDKSQGSFTVLKDGTVLGGFGDIKGWGPEAVRTTLAARERRAFASWSDFYGRTARSLGELVRLTGVHTDRLDTDVLLSIAPWYPAIYLNEIEMAAKAKLKAIPIRSLERAQERMDIESVPIVGRITAVRVVDMVAQAKKYGGAAPKKGEARYRAVVTVTDDTGSVDVSFSAPKWEEIADRNRIYLEPEEGRGCSVVVDLTFSFDRARIYGENLRIIRKWKRYEVKAPAKGDKLTYQEREEIGGQLSMAFEQIRSQEPFRPVR